MKHVAVLTNLLKSPASPIPPRIFVFLNLFWFFNEFLISYPTLLLTMRLHHLTSAIYAAVTFTFSTGVSAQLWSGPTFTASALPNLTSFENKLILAETGSLAQNAFTLNWNLENPGSQNETLHFVLSLAGIDNLSKSWMSIGFGPDMRHSEFIMCHLDETSGTVYLNEHYSHPGYAPPTVNSGSQLATPLSGGLVNGVFFCEGYRSTAGDATHSAITTSTAQVGGKKRS